MECQFLKGQMSRSPDVKKLSHTCIWCTCLFTGGGSSAGGSGADCKLGLTIVRPNLLSTPDTLGNWTDGRISCRHSVTTFFLFIACRRRRLLLYRIEDMVVKIKQQLIWLLLLLLLLSFPYVSYGIAETRISVIYYTRGILAILCAHFKG